MSSLSKSGSSVRIWSSVAPGIVLQAGPMCRNWSGRAWLSARVLRDNTFVLDIGRQLAVKRAAGGRRPSPLPQDEEPVVREHRREGRECVVEEIEPGDEHPRIAEPCREGARGVARGTRSAWSDLAGGRRAACRRKLIGEMPDQARPQLRFSQSATHRELGRHGH